MIQPHGGKLVDRVLTDKKRDAALTGAGRLARLTVDSEIVSDLENIATGVYSPLEGFLGEADFRSVLAGSRLRSDVAWTVPIVLDADEAAAGKLKIGDEVLLAAEDGRPVAILHLEEKYGYDKGETAEKVFGTRDPAHPGVAKVLKMKDVLLAGPIDLIEITPTPFDRWKLAPKETRVLFEAKGWKTVVGFQTRNTPHLGHEYVQKAALTFTDGLFINPVIGRKKKGDFKDEIILASYEEALRRYYVKERTAMAILQMEMRYAGPREAIHHAILRKNFGCTHIIIGRDHAGRRIVLRSIRRPGHLRRLPRPGHRADVLPVVQLVQDLRRGRQREDLPAPAGRAHPVQRHEDPRSPGERRVPAAGAHASGGGRRHHALQGPVQ